MKKIWFCILFLFTLFFYLDKVEAATLKDGVYKIESAFDLDKFVSISNKNEDNNIKLYSFNDEHIQKWKVENIDGDYYKISSFNNDEMVLSISDSNVSLDKNEDSFSQQWIIKSVGDGYYNVVSRMNNLYLDVHSTSTLESTDLIAGQGNNENNQKFKFVEVLEGEKTLEDGTYTISSALDLNKKINASGNHAYNCINVDLYNNNDTWGQVWNVKYLDNGYYSLTTFLDDNMSLDVYGGKASNGTNVQLYNHHGSSGQEWLIKETEDGYYNIISKLDNMYLDIFKGNTTNGTNVIMWSGNGGNNQKFKFDKVTKTKKTLEDGTYTISSALDLNKKINVNGNSADNRVNVNLYNNNDTWGQVWNVKYLDNGYYSLTTFLDDNMSLDVYGGKASNGVNVQLYNHHGSSGQEWLIKETGDGYYNIVSKSNNIYLDIFNGNTTNGTNVIMWKGNGGNNQKFKFDKTNIKKLEDGLYTINSKLDNNKTISVNSEIAFDGANVHLETFHNSNSQKWYISYLKNGYYKIVSALNKSKSLDVYGGKPVKGSDAKIYNYHGSSGQEWIIKYIDNDYYSLVSNCGSLYLDISNGLSEDGTNVLMWSGNGGDNQQFKLNKTNLTANPEPLKDGYYTISSNNSYLSIDGQFAYNTTNVLMKNQVDDSSKWYIKNVGNNLYEVRYALNQNKVLDIKYGNISDGTNVQVYNNNGGVNQKWYITRLHDGSYKIISSKSYSPLTIINEDAKIYSNNINKNQKFKITSIAPVSYSRIIEDGYYTINSSLNNKQVLDVAYASVLSGTNVQLYSLHNGLGQIWKIKYLDNGLYSIISGLNPKRSLTSVNGNIQMHKYEGSDNQKWYISESDGNMSIISASDGLYVSAIGDKATNGTNIGVLTKDNTKSQKFNFNSYGGTKTYKGIDISKWQGNINWNLLYKENPHFIIMRVGRGLADLGKDVKFEEYYKNATSYDIPVGVYIYSFATNLNEAKREAEYVLEWLGDKELDLPVFYDMEYSGQLYLGKTVLTEIAATFCEKIVSNDYHCGIYANIYWLNNFLDGKKLSNKYPIWLAHWTGANDYNTVLDNYDKFKSSYGLSSYKYWQFSSLGKYPGITENTVDLDFGYDIFD